MVNVILISDGERHAWYDWLSSELVKRGHSFFLPEMPQVSEGVGAWIDSLKEFRKYLDESSVVIGHGFGRLVVLRILEEKLRNVAGAIFVSGNPLISEIADFDFANFDFANFDFANFDFATIKVKADAFFVYGSEADSSESLKDSESLAGLLDDEVLILDSSAFFKGVDKFEELLIDIISVADS